MMDLLVSPHAEEEIIRRSLDREAVLATARLPDQVVESHGGRKAHQSRTLAGGKMYLLRVIVDPSSVPVTVVTAYRTSKIGKYWRTGS